MKIYVASAFANKQETREIQAILRTEGHEITHDWTQEDASHLPSGSPEFFKFLEDCGEADYRGITEANAIVVIAHPEMHDTKAEMGIALGLGIPVLVLNSERRHSVFYGLTIRVASPSKMLELLKELDE